MKGRIKGFRNNLISGVLVLVPFAAIVWLCVFIINVMGGMNNYHPLFIRNSENPFVKFMVSLLFIILILLVIAFIGWLSRKFIGRQILSFLDESISRLPMLGTIYGAIKQLVNVFSNKNNQFKAVCLVEFPRKGIRSIGFVTGETVLEGEKYFCVFVPTTPNPTSGFTLLLKGEDFVRVNMSVEAAFKIIVSMGVLAK
jgi:uncharacterized membrane protein